MVDTLERAAGAPPQLVKQRPRRLASELAPGSEWRGPHFARLDAWFARRARILAELAGGSAPRPTPGGRRS